MNRIFNKAWMLTTVMLIILWAPSYAISVLPEARHAEVGGEVFLGGDYLELGISGSGYFGTSGSAPTGFHKTTFTDMFMGTYTRSNIGLSIDKDGFDIGSAPTTGDYFLPGSPYEGFIIAYYTGDSMPTGVHKGYLNANGFGSGISSVTTDKSVGDVLAAETVGTTNDSKLKYTQNISFGKSDKYYKVDIEVENLSAETLYDVRYTRSFDPDQDADIHGEYKTINEVIDNPDVGSKALVSATGPVSGDSFFFLSMEPSARAAISTSLDPHNTTLYNSDGSALITGPTEMDTWIAITFDIGDVAVGEKKTITFYSSLNPDVDAGLGEISTSYNVSYDSNGATSGTTPSNQVKTSGSDLTLSNNTGNLTKTGYTFAGWNTASDGSGTDYAVGGTYSTESDVTLYAKWDINSYTVTFKDYDGTSLSTQSVDYLGDATAPSNPNRTGYSFSGWDTGYTGITGTTTVTATYTINSYTVTFKDYDGTSLSTQSIDYLGDATAPSNPSRTGYSFSGWDTGYTGITGTTTVTATYTINSYTVTFKDYDGTSLSTQSIDYLGDATAPSNPSRTGYSFSGWDTGYTGITGTTTVTATYTINSYTVSFDTNGGNTAADLAVAYGSTITSPTGTTRTGYALVGWFSDASLTQQWDFDTDTMPANDVVLYAKWTTNSYTVSFDANGGSSVADLAVAYGNTITSPVGTTRTGYTFAGWFSDASLTQEWDFDTDTMPAMPLTLHAKWQLIVDNDLLGLSVSGYSLNQAFDPNKTDYAVNNVVENNISITATVNPSQYATLRLNGSALTSGDAKSVTLTNGANVFTITVVAQDNSTKDYTLVVNKLSDKANLLVLDVAGYNVEPQFTTANTSYVVNMTTSNSVLVTVVPEADAHIDLSVYNVVSQQNVQVTTGSSLTYSTVSLTPSYGTNTYSFTVTAPNNIDTKTYVLSLINKSDDADLSSLKINGSEQTVNISGSVVTYNLTATTEGTMTIKPTTSSTRIKSLTLNGDNIISGVTQTVLLDYRTNTFTIVVTAENGDQKTYVINIVKNKESTTSTTSTGSTTPDKIEVIVNGERQNAGTSTTNIISGKMTTTVTVDKETIRNKIKDIVAIKAEEQDGESKNTIVIPVKAPTNNVVKAQLTGDLVKEMENDAFELTVSSNDIDYTIPAKEVKISTIATSLGIAEENLEDIVVDIIVDKIDDETSASIIAQAKNGNLEVIYPPVSFTVEATVKTADGETKKMQVSKFSSYVSRKVALPEGVDITKITTGVVYNEDGTFSHIPTRVVEENGIYYAVMNSPTNSNYSVVYHEVTVEGAEGHWSQATVNKLASRMIIDADKEFEPDMAITRGAFIEYITKGLGIYRSGNADMSAFTDLDEVYAEAITTAKEYGIVSGYADGTIRANNTITREEAMVMLTQALDAVAILEGDESENVSFTDEDTISDWAMFAVKRITSQHIMNGVTYTELSPQGVFTYAEAAATINNVLVRADLINE
jgi:uncharacterized repeat protein (TIGR02543 family)